MVDANSGLLKNKLQDEYKDFLRFTFDHNPDCSLSVNEQIILWWYVNRFEFPHLYIVSVAMLSIKPTSVTCESVFSKAAKLMSKHRCAMEMSTMDMCIALNSNYDLFEVALSKHSDSWRITMEKPEDVEKYE